MARDTSPAAAAPEAPRGASLSVRLFALILAIALPPLAALGILMIDVNADAIRESSERLHMGIAADARRAIRGELSRAEQELLGIGQLLIAPGLGDDDSRLKLASSKITASPLFDYAVLYDPSGVRAGTIKAEEAPLPDTAEQLSPERVEALSAGTVVGDVRPWNGQPAVDLFVPVKLNDQVRLLVGAQVSLERLNALVAELGEQQLGSKDGVMVVDGQRRVVLHADGARSLAREDVRGRGLFSALDGAARFTRDLGGSPEFTEDGRPMLGAFATVPEYDWLVTVRRPREVAYASLGRMRRLVIAAAVVAALIALVGAVIGARRITRPVLTLVRATREIATRAFQGIAPELASRGDELGHLGRSMETMARELAASEVKIVEETRIRSALSRYLSSDVVDLIVADPGKLKLGGERRQVTVLFADVCGFTRLSETLPPETIVALLNELFTFATEIVQKRGGIIDKFIGDSVMAVWGTPEGHPDDALRAVQAAEDLRRWLDTGNRRWRQKWGVEVNLAIGIHSGLAVAGNVGSDKRMEYTVIGDAVNVAARLESMAQPGQILVSEATRALLGEESLELRSLGEKALHGRTGKTTVFEVAA
jgi:class 3 adenylate cyclase